MIFIQYMVVVDKEWFVLKYMGVPEAHDWRQI